MLIPNHNVFSYMVHSVLPGSIRVFSQSRNYDIMALSDLAKDDLESGVWIDEYDYENKDKK